MYRYICRGHLSHRTLKTTMESKNAGFFTDFLFQGYSFQVTSLFSGDWSWVSSHPFEKAVCECACVCLYSKNNLYIYIYHMDNIDMYVYINTKSHHNWSTKWKKQDLNDHYT